MTIATKSQSQQQTQSIWYNYFPYYQKPIVKKRDVIPNYEIITFQGNMKLNLIKVLYDFKPVYKLEGLNQDYCKTLFKTLKEYKLDCEVYSEPTGQGMGVNSYTIVISKSKSKITELIKLSNNLNQKKENPKVTIPVIGSLLGYPPCCSDYFSHIFDQHDTGLKDHYLIMSHRARTKKVSYLYNPYFFFSHFTCSNECRFSEKIFIENINVASSLFNMAVADIQKIAMKSILISLSYPGYCILDSICLEKQQIKYDIVASTFNESLNATILQMNQMERSMSQTIFSDDSGQCVTLESEFAIWSPDFTSEIIRWTHKNSNFIVQ